MEREAPMPSDDKARDELIQQGMETVRDTLRAQGSLAGLSNLEISCLVDAGWRPPPSGDVVEQAERVIYDARHSDTWDESEGTFSHHIATFLADAGLLATPAQQDELAGLLEDAKRRLDAMPYRPSEFVRPIGLSDLIPDDDATVERMARAIHSIDKRKAQEDYGVTLRDWGLDARTVAEFKEYARAALRALGGPQQDERPGFVGMFRGDPDLSVRAKDIARGRGDDDDA